MAPNWQLEPPIHLSLRPTPRRGRWSLSEMAKCRSPITLCRTPTLGPLMHRPRATTRLFSLRLAPLDCAEPQSRSIVAWSAPLLRQRLHHEHESGPRMERYP